MANAVIGALRVNLGLDSAEFQNSIKQSQASAGKFGAALKTAFAAAAAGAAGALAGLAVSIRGTLGQVDEIAKQAQISNTSFEDFQRLAFATRSVGIEGDKLADILKDVNDRVGDFNQTGGGPMKDFFDNIAPKVNLTADAFKNLSGPQALQLYYDSLKKAGANQQQMTFYLEAMASDATALIPLLEKGGEGFRKLGAGASVISEDTSNRLRQFNQTVRNLGQAFSDVALSAVAALAPAFIVIAAGLEKVTTFVRASIQYLPKLAEYAAVAAGALALMAAPAILSAVASLTIAIGTGLVGAIASLTAIALANPLGALAIGITAAVVAVYHFRDEIQKAIGVDVVSIVKSAANLVINSFRAAFYDIKFVWANFPGIIGAAAIGAANIVIKSINNMVNGAKSAINELISAVNSLPGLDIGALDTNSKLVDEIANPYANALSGAADERNKDIAAIMATDSIGALADAYNAAVPAALNFGKAVSGVNKELAAGSGSKSGKTEAEKYAEIISRAQQRIASLKAERDSIGLTAEAAAKLQYETDLLNMAQQRGITLTAGQKNELSGLAGSMAAIEVATQKMRDALDFAKDTTKGFLSDFRQGLANGESVWKSFGNAALNVLNKIADAIETQLVDALFSANGLLGSSKSGSGGGLLGGLFSGLGKIFGFAKGGTILPGGAGGIDSQLVMFRKSPNERVDITKPGQTLSAGGGSMRVEFVPIVDGSGSLSAYVKNVSQGEARQAATAAVTDFSRNQFPYRMQEVQRNPRKIG